jgi:hypothetical protein
VWLDIARQLNERKTAHVFNPLTSKNIDLFLKLSVIGYLNSAVFNQMIRDPLLAKRLQQAANAAAGEQSLQGAMLRVEEMLKNEGPVIRAASKEAAMLRALAMLEPDLAQETKVSTALAWFRSLPPPAIGRDK